MMKNVIGIDLGGTRIKGVVLSEAGEILLSRTLPTMEDPEGKWRDNVRKMVEFLFESHNRAIPVIGLSAPGLANETNTSIAHLPNRLPGLENFDWSSFLRFQTYVINDAHAALMAEKQSGVLKPYQNAILITLGTGVGGGLLINGELYQGLSQMAGHLGHMSIDHHSEALSILGMPGSVEFALGNYSIAQRSHGRFQSTTEVVEAYQYNDPFGSWIWLDSIQKLAVALASLINIFSPEAIVLSGGISAARKALKEPLEQFLEFYEFKPKGKQTPILFAKYSEFSGAIGAAAYALKRNI